MTAIATLLVIAAFSLLAIRVATMALVMTGLSSDTASFQCYSAFLAIRRNEDFLPGISNRAEFIYPNDVVTLYGEEHAITKLMQSAKEPSIS